MVQSILIVTRFTLLEALRLRLVWVVLAVIICGLALAEGAASLALTDSRAYGLVAYASWTRLALVATVILLVATSVARDFDARALDLSLSRPLSRSQWYIGRLTGFALVATAIACAASLPLTALGHPSAAFAWGLSLAAELVLIAAATLCASIALGQVTAVVLAVIAFYLLSRSITAMVLMSHGPLVDPTIGSTRLIAHAIAVFALMLPPLDQFTATRWLTSGSATLAELGTLAAHTACYLLLLTAVGLFDFNRRDL